MTNLTKLSKIFSTIPEVKLAYFFGSRATNNFGSISDYDFAVYLFPYNPVDAIKTKINLISKLTKYLKTDNVDLLILNNSEKPELNYEVINNGKLLIDIEPNRVIFEPKVLNEYFDYKMSLSRYGLTSV